MSAAADVIVVGGGIVGTAAAAFLAEAGANVLLVEREGLASGASGANSGVVQHPFDPVLAALYRDTVALYRDLTAAGVGFRLPDEPAGMLFVAVDEAAVRRQAASIAGAFPELAIDVLGGADLHGLEPALAPDLWACRVGIGYPVIPAASTYAYATLAEARGVTVRQGRAASLEVAGDAAMGIRLDDQLVTAGAVLVAAGPWTPGLLDPSGRWAPIHPLWGVVVEAEVARPPHHALEEAGIDAAIGVPDDSGPAGGTPAAVPGEPPAADGLGPGAASTSHELEFSLVPQPEASSVGSTFLHAEPDSRRWMEPILVRAARFIPSVADAPIRGLRACARPQSVDGRPLIGPVPGCRGLFVCAGHGPWGISTGPASARLIADLVLGRGPAIPAPLDPGRFGVPGR
jgi:glycine/D-amino acid oxidase-like deaminating enzyme